MQEEERRAANPSYLAAAQQINFRMPPKRLVPAASARPADSPAFDLFFPTAATALPLPPITPKPPADNWSQAPSRHISSWHGGTGNRKDISDSAMSWEDALFQQDMPTGKATTITAPETFYESATQTEDTEEDILTLLGIAPAASQKSRLGTESNITENQEEAPSQSPMHIRPSSIPSSKESEHVSENDSRSRTKPCALCEQRGASYICLPCRHWGPCTSCVPNSKDKDALYPRCLRCEADYNCLVRVYKR